MYRELVVSFTQKILGDNWAYIMKPAVSRTHVCIRTKETFYIDIRNVPYFIAEVGPNFHELPRLEIGEIRDRQAASSRRTTEKRKREDPEGYAEVRCWRLASLTFCTPPILHSAHFPFS